MKNEKGMRRNEPQRKKQTKPRQNKNSTVITIMDKSGHKKISINIALVRCSRAHTNLKGC